MNKKLVAYALFLLLIVLLCFAITAIILINLFTPNTNKYRLKQIEANAIEYINQTYPDFVITDIDVTHEWKPNHYVVNYCNADGESRTIIFDHTGEKLFIDEYISNNAWRIVYDYEKSIKTKIVSALKTELSIDTYYVNITDKNAYGKDREIVLEGLDISNDPVDCSIGIIGEDDSTTMEFAKLAKDIYLTVTSLHLKVAKIEIHQQNNPESRFDISCPYDMYEMSIEEIEKIVQR